MKSLLDHFRSKPDWQSDDPAVRAEVRAAAVRSLEDPRALAAFVRERLRPGDVLLVKGSRGMKLETLVEALR